MRRYESLRRILKRRRCFKLVCGAGNEDVREVKKMALVYTLAGATILDISANVDVVEAAREGIDIAFDLAPTLKKKIEFRPYLNVSIGLKGDPHSRKAQIDKAKCRRCAKCLSCPQQAISDQFVVSRQRCIGCGACAEVCAFGAVKLQHQRADLSRILPECVQRGVELMELHAVSADQQAVLRDWRLLNKAIKNNFLSLCLDRSILSDLDFVQRIRQTYQLTGQRMIVQADGVPMSGTADDYNTTLQAIACADLVQKSGIPVMVLLSGGTNSRTGLLARQCAVAVHGVAVGSFARKIVQRFVNRDDFLSTPALLKESVAVAEKLIDCNIKAISG